MICLFLLLIINDCDWSIKDNYLSSSIYYWVILDILFEIILMNYISIRKSKLNIECYKFFVVVFTDFYKFLGHCFYS